MQEFGGFGRFDLSETLDAVSFRLPPCPYDTAVPSSSTTTVTNTNTNVVKETKKSSSKNIIITGGARGIGRATARHFLSLSSSSSSSSYPAAAAQQQQQQHRVFLIDVDAAELAYCVSTHLGAYLDEDDHQPRVRGFVADLRDPAQVRDAVHAAAAWFPGGRIDVLVNNAGVGPFWSGGRSMEDPETAAEWASVVATNLSAPFLASQAAIPFMKKRRVGGSGSGSGSNAVAAGSHGHGGEDEQKDKDKENENEAEKVKEKKKEKVNQTGIAATITDTIDSLADAIKTTIHLSDEKNDNDSSATLAAEHLTSSPSSSSSSSSSSSAAKKETDDDDDDRFAPGPCIIHISSFRAHRSDPNSESYAATKSGLVGLTHAMAVSAQRWGIRVNAISPGFISVRHECREGDAKAESWGQRHAEHEHALFPAGRVGRGEDVAAAVEFLAGAGYITGQELTIDGGAEKAKHILDP